MTDDLIARLREHAISDDGVSPYNADGNLVSRAAAHIETLETALRTIQSAVPKYLKKEMTAEEFALVVIGEVDSAMVNKALEVVKRD